MEVCQRHPPEHNFGRSLLRRSFAPWKMAESMEEEGSRLSRRAFPQSECLSRGSSSLPGSDLAAILAEGRSPHGRESDLPEVRVGSQMP